MSDFPSLSVLLISHSFLVIFIHLNLVMVFLRIMDMSPVAYIDK